MLTPSARERVSFILLGNKDVCVSPERVCQESESLCGVKTDALLLRTTEFCTVCTVWFAVGPQHVLPVAEAEVIKAHVVGR